MARIVVNLNGNEISEHSLDAERVVIGRDPATIPLFKDDMAVSRTHFSIEKVAGRFLLTDLGSTTGTFVNGKRVDRRTLNHGDLISISKYVIVFDEGRGELSPEFDPATMQVGAQVEKRAIDAAGNAGKLGRQPMEPLTPLEQRKLALAVDANAHQIRSLQTQLKYVMIGLVWLLLAVIALVIRTIMK